MWVRATWIPGWLVLEICAVDGETVSQACPKLSLPLDMIVSHEGSQPHASPALSLAV